MQYYPSYPEILAGTLSTVLSISSIIGIISYVFSSLGLYTIAKRRSIPAPGWAWVPVGSLFILGSLADQFDFVTKGAKKKQRHLLLWLSLAEILLTLLLVPLTIGSILGAARQGMDSGNADAFIGTVLLMVVFYIGLIALGIILTVFTYIAYYKVYRSCSPDNAVLFLVLSILFSFLTPFFLFACRNKDDGLMPPAPQQPYPPYGAQPPYTTQPPYSGAAPQA